MKLNDNLRPSQEDCVRPVGEVEMIIEYADGRATEVHQFKNCVLRKGREALAKTLARELGDEFEFYVNRMDFGDSGTTGGVPKYVDSSRNGLFCGAPKVSKPIISSFNANLSSDVIFTSVIAYDEGNGYSLSEMALRMANGDYYSMVTFPDLGKTSLMQITWNWRLSFV